MPELPEVEIAVRTLKKKIIHKQITNVIIKNPKLRYKINPIIKLKIKNKKIIQIKRRSKYILISLSDDSTLLVHLGMTGRFYFNNNNKKKMDVSIYSKTNILPKHDHFILKLNKINLIYNDIRKFGFIKLYKKKDLVDSEHIKNLGIEPFDKKLNYKFLKNKIKNKNLAIKSFLMDQKNICGLGNIYANEILFFSKIHPLKKTNQLSDYELKMIIYNLRRVLNSAIKQGGSTIKNYYNSEGNTGSYQSYFKVYGREKMKCFSCENNISKINISNRASFFCQKCQRH